MPTPVGSNQDFGGDQRVVDSCSPGTNDTESFQSSAQDVTERCVRLAEAHASYAPWVTPLELYEMLDVASSTIDRAQVTNVLEQQPFIGWRNLGAQSLTKTFFFLPAEASSSSHADELAQSSPAAARTDAADVLYIIRPPPPMVARRL